MEQENTWTNLANVDVSAVGVNVRVIVKKSCNRDACGSSDGNASITGGDYMNGTAVLASNTKTKRLLMKWCLTKRILNVV